MPEFGQKQDAVPGTEQYLVITPTKDGHYPIICTELCGLGHATMRTESVVMEPNDFSAWAAKQKGGGAKSGEAVFNGNGCAACHTLTAAGAKGTISPDLDRLAEEAKRAGKPLEEFVRESIVDPNAYIEKGFNQGVMPPTFAQSISKPDLDALVNYLVESAGGTK